MLLGYVMMHAWSHGLCVPDCLVAAAGAACRQVSALASEELVGDNQYYCDSCGRKCNADRQMRLRSLPPYLCLSLQRFVFDMQVGAAAVTLLSHFVHV